MSFEEQLFYLNDIEEIDKQEIANKEDIVENLIELEILLAQIISTITAKKKLVEKQTNIIDKEQLLQCIMIFKSILKQLEE